MKQVQTYRKQACQLLLARGAQNLRDAMYEQELHNAAINLAGNVMLVTRLPNVRPNFLTNCAHCDRLITFEFGSEDPNIRRALSGAKEIRTGG